MANMELYNEFAFMKRVTETVDANLRTLSFKIRPCKSPLTLKEAKRIHKDCENDITKVSSRDRKLLDDYKRYTLDYPVEICSHNKIVIKYKNVLKLDCKKICYDGVTYRIKIQEYEDICPDLIISW